MPHLLVFQQLDLHDLRRGAEAVEKVHDRHARFQRGGLRDQREVLRRMLHSTKRLSRMAAAMFQLSVGRHVKRHPELKRGDLRECVEQSLHEVLVLADEKRVQINVDLSPESCPVYLEPNQIQQVLVNLLDNALRYNSGAPGALLVQQCSRDALYPMSAMRAAVNQLTAIYAKAGMPDRFRAAFHDVPHSFGPEMQEEAFAWLEKQRRQH